MKHHGTLKVLANGNTFEFADKLLTWDEAKLIQEMK